jgi:predicted nucleotidyltransferase
LRRLGSDFDPTIVAEIDRCLCVVSENHQSRVVLAVESGSRAWGFPSPDSDYDCRFIYVRRRDDYLTLFPPRDVIEFPPDVIIDVNGWDLGKALRLLLKGNAVVIEWLMSPFVYAGDERFCDEALMLARQVVRPAATARHYLHLGERQRRTYFADERPVPIKKLFYALRPALALRWLRLHAGQSVAPMHFPTLAAACDLPSGVVEIIDQLLKQKAVTRELGAGPMPAAISTLIELEFSQAREIWSTTVNKPDLESSSADDALFRCRRTSARTAS